MARGNIGKLLALLAPVVDAGLIDDNQAAIAMQRYMQAEPPNFQGPQGLVRYQGQPNGQVVQPQAAPELEKKGCGGGERGAFGNYAAAGLLRFVSTGPNAFDDDSITVSGDDLPEDSILLVVSHRTAAGAAVDSGDTVIQAILADNIPAAVGDGGTSLALADIRLFNATGVSIQHSASKELKVQVQFGPNSTPNDVLLIQALSRGLNSLAKQMCLPSRWRR